MVRVGPAGGPVGVARDARAATRARDLRSYVAVGVAGVVVGRVAVGQRAER